MPLGLGGNRQTKYFVVPKPRLRNPRGQPDKWAVVKGINETGGNTVSTHNTKGAAESRAKELARKNDTAVISFDAAKKSSRTFNYA